MSSKGFLLYFNVLYLVLIFVGFQGPVQRRLFSEKKPAPKDVAARARRLVSHNIWGVLRYSSPFLVVCLICFPFAFIFRRIGFGFVIVLIDQSVKCLLVATKKVK
jgi:hypothetical protein